MNNRNYKIKNYKKTLRKTKSEKYKKLEMHGKA